MHQKFIGALLVFTALACGAEERTSGGPASSASAGSGASDTNSSASAGGATSQGAGGSASSGANGGAGGSTDAGGAGGAGGTGGGSSVCVVDATQSCYGGDPKLAGVGICTLGTQTCIADGEFFVWGPCEGWVGPQTEMCDNLDSDCDGDLMDAPCPLACDGVSPVFSDPFKDGSLRLKGTDTAGFDAPLVQHSWICSQDMARINVCDSTTIELAGGTPTVIGGQGIGSIGNKQVHIVVKSNASDPIWILLDATQAAITLELNAPLAPVTVTSKGSNTVYFGGSAGDILVQTEGGLTVNIPITSQGGVVLTAGASTLTPPSGCP